MKQLRRSILINLMKFFNRQWLACAILYNCQQTFRQTAIELWTAHTSWTTIVELIWKKWHLQISNCWKRHCPRILPQLAYIFSKTHSDNKHFQNPWNTRANSSTSTTKKSHKRILCFGSFISFKGSQGKKRQGWLQSSTPWQSDQGRTSNSGERCASKMQSYEEIRAKICQSHCDKAGPRSFFAKAYTPCFHTFVSSSFIFFCFELLVLKIEGAQAVLDPEPKLPDSNFVEPNNLQLLFRPSGKYLASTHFIHIRVPFNFSQLS